MGKRRIYVASSWRNATQPHVVETLRKAGHHVYDFRAPPQGDAGFSWREIEPDWENWTPEEFRRSFEHPRTQQGLKNDYLGMDWADAFVAVAPFGRSASLELGWAIGKGKPAAVLLARQEPELMFGLASKLCVSLDEVVAWLASL